MASEMKFAARRLSLGVITALSIGNVWARGLGGEYTGSPLEAWFDQLGGPSTHLRAAGSCSGSSSQDAQR